MDQLTSSITTKQSLAAPTIGSTDCQQPDLNQRSENALWHEGSHLDSLTSSSKFSRDFKSSCAMTRRKDRAMIMPLTGSSSLRHRIKLVPAVLLLSLMLFTSMLSAQNGSSRFVPENDPDVMGYLTRAEQLYHDGQIDASLALIEIAAPLVEVDDNRQAVDGMVADLKGLQTKRNDLLEQLPSDIDRVAEYTDERFQRGLASLESGDLEAAEADLMFAWLAGGNYQNARGYLDEIQKQKAAMAAEAAPLEDTMAPEIDPIATPDEEMPSDIVLAPFDEMKNLKYLASKAQAQGNDPVATQLYLQAQLLDPADTEVTTALAALQGSVLAGQTLELGSSDLTDDSTMPDVEQMVDDVQDQADSFVIDSDVDSLPEEPAIDSESIEVAMDDSAADTDMDMSSEVDSTEAEMTMDDAPSSDGDDSADPFDVDEDVVISTPTEPTGESAEVTRLTEQADSAFDAGNYDLAIRAYEAALDLSPDDTSLTNKLERARLASEAETAAPIIGDPFKVERLITDGNTALNTQDYQRASALFAEALELDPTNSRAQDGMQQASAGLEQIQQMEAGMAERANEMQQEQDDLMMAAQAELDAGNFDEAANTALSVLDINPEATAEVDTFLGKVDAARQEQSQVAAADEARLLYEAGRAAYRDGDYDSAVANYTSAVDLQPNERRYTRALENAIDAREDQMERDLAVQSKEQRKIARQKYKEGVSAYKGGDIEEARRLWQEAVDIAPDYAEPQVQLDETEEEFEEYAATRTREAMALAREQEAVEKLNTPITLSTPRTIPLENFLDALSSVSGINYSIQGGVDAEVGVNVRFEEQPLNEVLDNVLIPNGLKWERRDDFIVIMADLTTEVFPLSGDQARKVRVLIDSGELANLLSPPGATKVSGKELRLDDRRNLLIVTDSEQNLAKLSKILDGLEQEAAPELVFRTYRIRERQGPEIKSLLENILKVGTDVPFNVDRRILLDGDTLIIQDTPENIARAEEILLDRKLLNELDEDRLGIEVFSLIPREELLENREQLQAFGDQVVTVIRTFLYAEIGESESRRQGRRLWYDPALLNLTIVDTQSNLREVADFIAGLPQLAQEERFEFILLQHADAGDIAGQINRFLGIDTSAQGGSGGSGEEVTRSIRVDDELEFRDLTIRALRVNENDANDDNDDNIELVIRTPTESRDVTIEEFRSEFIGDYELTALEVRPSGTPGEGSARLEVRFVPAGGTGGAGTQGAATGAVTQPGVGGAAGQAVTPELAALQRAAEVSELIRIDSVDSLNALVIRFRDVSLYNKVIDLIAQLDIPVPQVSIATNFVEVNETRAKEFGSEFALQNILNDDFNFSDGDLNVSFGRDVNELRSIFEPPIEMGFQASLLKGTTAFSFDFGALSGNLQFLETEGILNVATGPQVTVQSGESATFEITLFSRSLLTLPTAQDGGGGNQDSNAIDLVELDVSPTVTQLGSITLDLDVRLQEIVQDAGARLIFPDANRDPDTDGAIIDDQDEDDFDEPQFTENIAIANNFDYTIKEKELTTKARVLDGGTIVLGGFTGERSRDLHSGVPVLRNLPFVGKILFGRNLTTLDKTTMLIFLNANLVE
jgi:type II secretory pathway component GspD/PulD (secretin)